MKDMELLHKLEDIVTEELKRVAKKGDVQPAEWLNFKAAVCIMKEVKQLEQMLSETEMDEGYSSRSYNTPFMPRMAYDGNRTYRVEGSYDNQNGSMSRARGRSRTTGRYVSRDSAYDMGRSNHSIKDRMVDSLERMYDEAVTEHEKATIDDWIHKIESSER